MIAPRSHRTPAWLVPALALLVAACGRPSASDAGGDDGGTTTSPTTTSTPSDTSGEDPSGQDSMATETETETGGETDSTTGTPFVVENDAMGDPCDPWAQDCPEGEKCVPYATTGGTWDSTKCVPILGDQAPGEACVYGGAAAATDDCDADSICWDAVEVEGELIGECVPQCTGTPDQPMCPEGYRCLLSGSGVLALCLPFCDPLIQDCDAGEACYWANTEFTCIPIADDGVGVEPGQPCSFVNDCASGSLCVAGEVVQDCADAACCTSFCPLDGDGQACAAQPGTNCVAFFAEGEAPPGYEEVGVCVLP